MPSDTNILNGLLYALGHAAQWGKWVVVVVPDSRYQEALRDFSAASPEGALFSGRTCRLENGCVSLVSVTQTFIPPEPFSVLFVGWGGKHDGADLMGRWRDNAAETLSLVT